MKNGKKIGKKVASGIMKFGEGAREAYAERYGTKPKKRKATKKVKPKKKVLIEKKTLKITLKDDTGFLKIVFFSISTTAPAE